MNGQYVILNKTRLGVEKKVVLKCSPCRVASSILHEIVHLHSQSVRCDSCNSCGNKADLSFTQSVAEVKNLDIPTFVLKDITETPQPVCYNSNNGVYK